MSGHQAGFIVRGAALAGLVCATSLASSTALAQSCDRNCLSGLMTQYIDALVAHDSSRLTLADEVKYTEDSRPAQLGEGIWQSVTANGGFRQDYIDTRKQVVAAHVLLREGDTQALYSVLLHVTDRKIAGIETLVQRVVPGGRFQPTELGAPIRGMNDPVPALMKNTREEMIRIALTYPEGLRVGNFTDGGTPFAAEAYRVENGVITADQTDPRRRMYEQNIIVHPGIIPSVAAVDEEKLRAHRGFLWCRQCARNVRGLQGLGRRDPLGQRVLQGPADIDGAVLAERRSRAAVTRTERSHQSLSASSKTMREVTPGTSTALPSTMRGRYLYFRAASIAALSNSGALDSTTCTSLVLPVSVTVNETTT